MNATQTVEDVKDAAPAAAQELENRAQEMTDRVQARAEELWGTATTWVRENPGTAIGAALAGGLVIGGILARSNRRSAPQAAADATATARPSKENVARTLESLRGLLDEALTRLR